MSTRYQHLLGANAAAHFVPAAHFLPASAQQTVLGSLGAALAIAERVGGMLGSGLATAARAAFMSGMSLALQIAAGVVLAGVVVALVVLPSRAPSTPSRDTSTNDSG
jgi:DHA2 family multidrug resistance protein-like MFS transporter